MALPLPANMPFDEWRDLGVWLCTASKALNWHIGDWWAFGGHAYGDRAKAAAEGIFGRAFQSLANTASVCRAIETSRRREVLSFSHHAEVAALDPPDADALLDQAEAEGWSKSRLRAAVNEWRNRAPEQTPEETMETAELAKSAPGPAAVIPEGGDLIDLCRKGISLERDGQTVEGAADELGLARNAYRVSRQIVFLADHIELSSGDEAIVADAFNLLAKTQQYGRAWEMAEPVALKVWGAGQRWERLTTLAERRLQRFEQTFAIVMQSCLTTDEIELPYLSSEQIDQFTKEINGARKALSVFAARIKEMHQ
jgi:hypothetical protein